MYDKCDTCVDGGYDTVDRIGAGQQLSGRDATYLVALYDGEVSFADREIGRLLDSMKTSGYAADTMVIVTADEGESLNGNGLWFHPGILYNSVIRVTLIVSYPGVFPQGRVVNTVARSVDIMPTILDMAGVASPSQAEGSSLRPVIQGQEGVDERVAYAEGLYDEAIAVVAGEWKLIRNNSTGQLQLYNLVSDPGEANNVAADNPEKASELEQHVKDWMERHGIVR